MKIYTIAGHEYEVRVHFLGGGLNWHERSALQSVGVRRATGNYVSGTLFSTLFSSIPPFPSQPFLIEGVLRSKNLFSES